MTTVASFFRKPLVLWIIGIAIAVILVVLPLVSDPLINQTLTRILVAAVAVLGLNVIMGYTGQVSLGQIFFVGVGAYAAAFVLRSEWGQSLGAGVYVVAFLFAVVIPGVVGMIVALAAARLRGLAIAMVTIALPLIGVPLAKRLSDITGGSQGISVRYFKSPDPAILADDQWQYFVVLIIAAAVFALGYFLVRGKYGRAFAIVKANEAVAASMGVSPYRYKVLAFTIASIFGGISGFMTLVAYQFYSPDSLNFGHSIELVIATIVGGSASIAGSVLGGAFYVLVPQLTQAWGLGAFTLVIQGIVIILILFVLPGGLASLPKAIRRRMKKHRTPDSDGRSAAPSATQDASTH